MDPINREIANLLREIVRPMRTDSLVKLESERELEKRLGAGRQRIRAVIHQLMSEGLLVKQEGKGTFVTPLVRNKYLNLICSPDVKNNDPFYNNLLMELTNFAAKESVNICLTRLEDLSTGFPAFPALVVGKLGEADLVRVRDVFPTVIAFENYIESDEINQIYFDHYRIGWNAAKALTDYGHRKILHLTGPNRYASSSLRRNGFIDAARKYNVEYTVLSGKMNFQGGYRAGEAIADVVRAGGCTAAFVVNDWMAVGLMQYMKENSLRIPEDLSVVGVDNIPLSSQISPSLTTFSLDVRMMIAEVFVLLNAMSAEGGGKAAPDGMRGGRRVILTPVLITRESIRRLDAASEPEEEANEDPEDISQSGILCG